MTEATKTVHPMMVDVITHTVQLLPARPDRKKLLGESQSWLGPTSLQEEDLVFIGDFDSLDEFQQNIRRPDYLKRKLFGLIREMYLVLDFRLKKLQTEVPVIEMLARGVHRTKIVEEILVQNGVTFHGIQLEALYWCGER